MPSDTVRGWCPECGPAELEQDGRDLVCVGCASLVETVEETRSERIEREMEERLDEKTTVGELIEQLEGHDPDAPVVLTLGGAWNYASAETSVATVGGHEVVDVREEP